MNERKGEKAQLVRKRTIWKKELVLIQRRSVRRLNERTRGKEIEGERVREGD